MASLLDEHTQFTDESTGALVNNGFIYIGDDTLDPVANPQTIYSDRALTVTLTNPQRTGVDGRSVNKIFVTGRYSIEVQDENNVQLLQSLTAGELSQTGISTLGNVLGTNTITADGSPTVTSLVDGQVFNFIAAGTVTGAVTLQIDATSALAVLKYHDLPIIAGDIEANQAVTVIYNDTDTVFELISSTISPEIRSITATVAASALTLGLNPTTIYFRRTSLTDGTPAIKSSGAISLVVPSGATLGTTNAAESRITLILINTSGVIELACINALDTNLNETGLITTIAITSGADSADVFYSNSARTSVPYRVVGFEDSTQSTAGTWDTSPTLIQGIGGEVLSDRINILKTKEIVVTERSDHTTTPIAGKGIDWVRDDTPNVKVFTDDAGTDFDISPKQGTFQVTLAPSTSGTITINTAFDTLAFEKTGNLCHVQGQISVTSVSSPVGSVVVMSGLPFTCATLAEEADVSRFAVHMLTLNVLADGFHIGETNPGATTIDLRAVDGSALADDFQASTNCFFNFSYITA